MSKTNDNNILINNFITQFLLYNLNQDKISLNLDPFKSEVTFDDNINITTLSVQNITISQLDSFEIIQLDVVNANTISVELKINKPKVSA